MPCLVMLAISFKLQLAAVGIFIFLVWYFVLRKYRSLGLRLFFLFSLIAALACTWLYTDIQNNKSMEQNGHVYTATVLEKNKTRSESGSTNDNQITISFDDATGIKHVEKTSEYISIEEYEALKIGQKIEVLYNPVNKQTYYTVSFARYKNDQWFLYAFPAFLFLIGLVAGIVLRKYKVGVHAGTGLEYVEKDGNIILDERGNALASSLKHANIASKLFHAFK